MSCGQVSGRPRSGRPPPSGVAILHEAIVVTAPNRALLKIAQAPDSDPASVMDHSGRIGSDRLSLNRSEHSGRPMGSRGPGRVMDNHPGAAAAFCRNATPPPHLS